MSLDRPPFSDLISDYFDDIRQRLIFYYDYLDGRYISVIARPEIDPVEEGVLARQLAYVRGLVQDMERLASDIPDIPFKSAAGRAMQ